MTSPTVAATNTSAETANITTHTVNLPADISSGNLLIVVFGCDGSSESVTFPNGWTELTNTGFYGHTICICYRQADGTEGGTISVTTSSGERSAHISYRITGHINPSTTAPEMGTLVNADNLEEPNPPSISPAGGSKDYLFITPLVIEGNTGELTQWPYGDNQVSATSESGFGVMTHCCSDELTESTEDPRKYIRNTSAGAAAVTTIAIYPYEAGVEVTSINIGDTFKTIDWTGCQINIGDSWKAIAEVSINIGDTWKTVYS